jgi:hypothetical protein
VALIEGTRVSSRTRARVDMSMVQSVAKEAEQQVSVASSDKEVVDLTASQADVQSKAPAKKASVPDQAKMERAPSECYSQPRRARKTIASKKRKAESADIDAGEESDSDVDFHTIGDAHIADFAATTNNKRLSYKSRDLNRTGLGQIFEVGCFIFCNLRFWCW